MAYQDVVFVREIGMCLLGFYFLGIALRGFLTQRPFLLSNRWPFAAIACIFIPNFLFVFVSHSFPGPNLMPLNLTVVISTLAFGVFFWKFSKGYSVYGITDKSFRKLLLYGFDRLKVECAEEMNGLRIKSSDAYLKTSVVIGTGRIMPRGEGAQDLLRGLEPVLREKLQGSDIEFSPKPFLFYLCLSGFLLLINYFVWSLHNSILNH